MDYDETQLGVVSAWVDGRIDKLFIDFTGVTVHRGHDLVSLYSPKLISGENEYLLALDNLDQSRTTGREQSISSAQALVASARQRLSRWGLSESQLDHLEKSREVEDHITISAPQGGTVIEKQAYEGQYVKEGDVLFRIANLSTVWLYAEIYEDDLPFLYQARRGDYYGCPMHRQVHSDKPGRCPICGMDLVRTNDDVKVHITTRALPGETFEGRIAFTDPFLNPQTRTVRIRVNIDNPEQKLKPNMFARAHIVVPRGETLAVPENAVLQSGERSIVLVEEAPGTFRPQLVRLGDKWLNDVGRESEERTELAFHKNALRYHEVLAGLNGGERIVTSGNFLLGSESQLQGALANMSAASDSAAGGDTAPDVSYQFSVEPALDRILDDYYAITAALTQDTIGGIHERAEDIASIVKSKSIAEAVEPLRHAHHKNDIEATRADYRALSDALVAYVASHRASMKTLPQKAYCPMKDANWLQKDEKDGKILNPYYGSRMLHCGNFEDWD
jgi:RND family efflux transporter MFP subunit